MFILRQVLKTGDVTNHCIGERYTVTSKEFNPEHFNDLAGDLKNYPQGEKIFAIVTHDDKNNSASFPLYVDQYYYIMTESGKTFENITHK